MYMPPEDNGHDGNHWLIATKKLDGDRDQMLATYIDLVASVLRRFFSLDQIPLMSSTLEPGRPATSNKLAVLGDAIRVLYQLNTEIQETKETNVKLEEELKTLKDVQFTIGQPCKFLAAFWYPVDEKPWHGSAHYSGCDWVFRKLGS